MPGYVIHLALCERLIKELRVTDDVYKAYFRIGSIAPDIKSRSEKKESHFWSDEIYKKLKRKPDIEAFLNKYGDKLDDPYVFGYYTHLVFDRHFIDDYWDKHFSFYNDEGCTEEMYDKVKRVFVSDNQTMYDRNDFFSDRLYYGDYDRANEYFLKKYDINYEDYMASFDYVMSNIENRDYNIGGVLLSESAGRTKYMLSHLDEKKYGSGDKVTIPKLTVLNVCDIDELIKYLIDYICR